MSNADYRYPGGEPEHQFDEWPGPTTPPKNPGVAMDIDPDGLDSFYLRQNNGDECSDDPC